MRRMLKYLAILAAVLLPVWALAQSRADFNLNCTVKTAEETALYSVTRTEDGSASLYTKFTTVPADTPLRLTGAQDDNMRECWYYEGNAARKAWVDASALESAIVTVYLDDGSKLLLTEALAHDEAALAAYFAERYPGRAYGLTPPPTPTPAPIVPDAWLSAEKSFMCEQDIAVQVLQLGITETTFMDHMFDVITVPTDQMIFADGVDAEHLIAVIHAPRSGSAALRDKGASNGKKLDACTTGRIVPVLEYGEDFTLIRYEGQQGWVLTDAMQFFPGGGSTIGQGVLHLKGKTDGEDNIVVRTTASSSSAKVGEWKTGTAVTVLQQEGVWYAVEYAGWYGYVHQQYLTIEGE